MSKRSSLIFSTLAVVGVSFASLSVAEASEYYVSSTLLDDCQQSINVWEGRAGDHHAGAMCLGFINGVLTSQSLYRANGIDCRPEQIPPGAVAYALNSFIKKHPNRIGDPAAQLLEDVLDSMYHCPQNAQSE